MLNTCFGEGPSDGKADARRYDLSISLDLEGRSNSALRTSTRNKYRFPFAVEHFRW